MIPEVHTTTDERKAIGQTEPPAEPPPAAPVPPTGTMEVRLKESPMVTPPAPPPIAPPSPPRNRLVARIQQMPPGGRWVLGLTLALVAGFGFLFSPLFGIGVPMRADVLLALAVVLALVAGFVLSSWRWWAVLALADAGAVGGFVASWALTQADRSRVVGGGDLGQALYGFGWFMLLGMLPLVVLLLVGIGLGKLGGMPPVPPHSLSTGAGRVGRWVAVLVPPLVAGLLAAGSATIEGPVSRNIGGLSAAILLAVPCFMAGWLLRSWWGAVAAPVIYSATATGVAGLMASVGGGGGTISAFAVVIYIVLPAVVMSAIGTAIGVFRANRAEQQSG